MVVGILPVPAQGARPVPAQGASGAVCKHVLKYQFQKDKKASSNLAKVKTGPNRTSFKLVWNHFFCLFLRVFSAFLLLFTIPTP